jgi:hypothetical protein
MTLGIRALLESIQTTLSINNTQYKDITTHDIITFAHNDITLSINSTKHK